MDEQLHANIVKGYDYVFFDKGASFFGRNRHFLDRIGFFNYGYWKGIEGDSIERAQVNLMETLISFYIPKNNSTVLDVGCGKGATTKFLTRYFNPQNITGINVSESQLAVCRTYAPECTFRRMDAASLDFDDSSIDNILCVEATHHFRTQRKFLQEAFRVLKPGGRLAMQDLLHDEYMIDNIFPGVIPRENYLASASEFRDILASTGFRHVRVDDHGNLCTMAVSRAVTKMLESDENIDPARIAEVDTFHRHYIGSFSAYAIK